MHQWNGAVHPLAQGVFTPPCFIIHNLNHVSAFSYSCFVLLWLAIAYRSLHLTLTGVDLSTYVILSFFTSVLFFAPINFLSVTRVRQNFDFEISPPPDLSLPFIFFHFSIFSSPLTLPDLLQPAFFTCLFFVSLCSLCFLCGRKGESDWTGECAVSPTTFLDSTVPERKDTRTWAPHPRP